MVGGEEARTLCNGVGVLVVMLPVLHLASHQLRTQNGRGCTHPPSTHKKGPPCFPHTTTIPSCSGVNLLGKRCENGTVHGREGGGRI